MIIVYSVSSGSTKGAGVLSMKNSLSSGKSGIKNYIKPFKRIYSFLLNEI